MLLKPEAENGEIKSEPCRVEYRSFFLQLNSQALTLEMRKSDREIEALTLEMRKSDREIA